MAEVSNRSLACEGAAHQETQEALREANRSLELRVTERTAQLTEANRLLSQEVLSRKQVEGSVHRLAAIVSSTDEAIVGSDLAGNITDWNFGAVRLFGYSEEAAIGKPLTLIAPPERSDEVAAILAKVHQGERVQPSVTVCLRKDSTLVDVSIIHSPIKNGGGETVGVSVVARDITERMRAEKKLRDAEERMRSIVDHVVDGIISIDEHATVKSYNPAAERIFGYSASEVIGQNVKLLMPEPFHSEHDGYIGNYLQTGQAKIIGIGREVFGRRKDGSTFPMDLAISAFRLGEARYFTGIVRDITERKKQEESLLTYGRLLMQTFDPALIWDFGGVINYWNRGAERVYGFTTEEAVGRISHELLGSVFPVGSETCEQKLRGQGRWEGEIKHKTKGGEWITVDSRMTLVEEPGRSLRVLEVNRDITHRKEAEDRMRSVVDHVVDGIISIDEHGIVKSYNPAAQRIFGYDAQQVIGQNVNMLMPEPFHGEHDGYIANYLRTGQAKIIGSGREVIGRRKDGSTFPMELAISVFRLGAVRNFTGIVRDITERKRAEAEHREAEERMRSIVDHVVDGIITIDQHGKVESYNPAAQRIFGYDAQEVIGQNVKVLMPEPFHGEHDGYLVNYMRSGEAKIIGIGREVVGRRKDGSTFPMDLAVSAFQLGQRRYFTGIVRDISERKRAELELLKAAQELGRSNLDLEQFAYVASHDLQEPLRAVSGCVQVLKKRYQGQLDGRANELIAHTVEGVNRMQTLIDDLLAYSRVGTRGKDFEPTDCNAVLIQALANLRVAIEEAGAVLSHDQLPVVKADAPQLTQLFQNLVSNAAKFRSQQPPRLHVAVCHGEGHWVFSVKDNGIGMQPEYFERIFIIFQRLHTRAEYPGTGIGLAICKKIVERHGGRIWLESEPGKGTTFYFTIPDNGAIP